MLSKQLSMVTSTNMTKIRDPFHLAISGGLPVIERNDFGKTKYTWIMWAWRNRTRCKFHECMHDRLLKIQILVNHISLSYPCFIQCTWKVQQRKKRNRVTSSFNAKKWQSAHKLNRSGSHKMHSKVKILELWHRRKAKQGIEKIVATISQVSFSPESNS